MTETPLIRIRRGQHWQGLGLSDIWAYRGLLLSLGLRDVKLRYRQTVLGVLWVVLQPLLGAGVVTIVFGLIAEVEAPDGVPYFAYAYVGQLAWGLFAQTLARTSGSMIGGQAFVTKIYFPRPILPLATIAGVLLDFAMSAVLAVPIVALYSRTAPDLVLAAYAGVLLLMLATGVGFVFAATSVWVRDILFVLPLGLQLMMYASPVAYGLVTVRQSLQRYPAYALWGYMLNPLAAPIEVFRTSLLGSASVSPVSLVYSSVCAAVVVTAGFVVFRSLEGKFADAI